MARGNLEDARRSVLDLRGAAQLEGKPLAEALAGLARAFTSETGVPAAVDSTNVNGLPLRVESELFRIAQEALANVRKHAHAHRVHIGLRRRGTDLSLVVRDDGRGFVVATARRGDGQGLIGMRERARLLGGQLQISSRPGEGTRVTVRVPLEQEST
jgi:two-component system NarL family sensor kinase